MNKDILQDEIRKTVQVLRDGGTILYPTDTIWGLGCDSRNEQAVQAIYDLKQRSASKSMIVLLDNDAKLNRYVKEVPEVAWDLLDHTDKPLTIIYPGAKGLAKNLIAEDETIAIRVAKSEFCEQVIRHFKFPIVSTSANISNQPSPTSFASIDPAILNGVDYVVNLPDYPTSTEPSSIIKLAVNGEFSIIR